MATWTRKALRQRIGGVGYCDDMIAGTATGGSTTTLLDTTLKNEDDAFNRGQVVILTGSAAGDYRTITDWVQSTGTLTPDRAFTAAVASTNTYEIHREFSATRKNDAINQAVLLSKWRWARRIEDESITMAADTYTYSLASLTPSVDPDEGIDEVWYDNDGSGTGYPFVKLSPDDWMIRNDDGVLTLQLLIYPPNIGDVLRLIYRTRPRVFTTDTTTNTSSVVGVLEPDNENFAAYVCAKATELLYRGRAQKHAEDPRRDDDFARADYFATLAETVFSSDRQQAQPGVIKTGAFYSPSGLPTYTSRDVTKVRIP